MAYRTTKKDGTPSKPMFGGHRHKFLTGYDSTRNLSGTTAGFIKVKVRLSRLMNDELANQADEFTQKTLGLAPGASWGAAVVKSMILAAATGDVGAARFVHDCAESAKQRPSVKLNLAITPQDLNQAINVVRNLPELLALEAEQGEILDVD